MSQLMAALRTRKARVLMVGAAATVAVIAARGGPGGTSNAEPSDAAALDYVRSHRLDLGAPGIAAVVVHGAKASVTATGDATTDTPFVIGSATKSFTALAVLQLTEAGRIRLDEPAVHYVPDFATSDPAVSDRITVRQLLSHTSGLSTATGTDPLAGPVTTLHRQVLALRSATTGPPGRFEYSNANYEVLGDVVEHVSGTSYGEYLQAHVLAPLAMTHTYTDLASARAHGLREGHRIWFGVGIGDGYWYRADFLPAGSLVSTVGDLGHYLTALLDGGRYQGRSVLSPAGVQALTTSVTTASLWGVQGGYGLGWYQRPTAGQHLAIDPGITPNSHADLVLAPDQHVGVAVLEDAESSLYLANIPKFDILAMNVAAIATTGSAPTGMVEGYYLIFDLIALAALLTYSVILARVLRSRDAGLTGRPWYRRLVTLWRELLIPFVIIVRLPDLLGEPWHTLIRGDVGLVAALVAVLGLATMTARLVFASRRVASSATPISTSPDRDAVTLAGSRS